MADFSAGHSLFLRLPTFYAKKEYVILLPFSHFETKKLKSGISKIKIA
jgi:hypothetical protein